MTLAVGIAEALDAADSAIGQVLVECAEEAVRSKRAWVDNARPEPFLTPRDIAADICRRLTTAYGLESP